MTFNYDSMRLRAYTLVSRFGRDMVLRSTPAGTYDQTTGVVTANTVVAKVKGVMVTKRDNSRPDTATTSAQRQVIIAAQGIYSAPKQGDQVEFGAERLQIVSVESVSPAGKDVVYICNVAR